MSKVTVFRVKTYDGINDEWRFSRRMATREGAKIMCGVVLEETAVEIDSSQLEPGEQWTSRDFNPKPRQGFQTQVE